MREEVNLKISQFVDGELAAVDALKLLKSMDKERELSNVFRRYDAISQALKSDVFLVTDSDFVDTVAARIQDEAVVFAPGRRILKPQIKAFTAVAASVAIVSVIVAGSLQFKERSMLTQLSLHQPSTPIFVTAARPRSNDARFNEYLEAHGATLYAGKYAAAQTYGQAVKYERK